MGNMKDIGLACEEYDVPPVGIRVEELLEIMEGRGRGRGAGMRGGAGAPGGGVAEVDGEVAQGASGVDGFRGGGGGGPLCKTGPGGKRGGPVEAGDEAGGARQDAAPPEAEG